LATIQTTALYSLHHHERFYNPFLQVSEYILLKLEQILMQIPANGYLQLQRATPIAEGTQSQPRLNANCIKTQRSVAATLATLIYNQPTQGHLAVHRCIMSG